MRNESNRLEELFIETIRIKMNKDLKLNIGITLWTLTSKEIRRFMRIWVQTLVPPAVTILYFVIFGSLIGPRIGEMDGFDYVQFMIPGLIMMSVITGSYANVVSSFYSVKFQKSIEELNNFNAKLGDPFRFYSWRRNQRNSCWNNCILSAYFSILISNS